MIARRYRFFLAKARARDDFSLFSTRRLSDTFVAPGSGATLRRASARVSRERAMTHEKGILFSSQFATLATLSPIESIIGSFERNRAVFDWVGREDRGSIR